MGAGNPVMNLRMLTMTVFFTMTQNALLVRNSSYHLYHGVAKSLPQIPPLKEKSLKLTMIPRIGT